MSTNFKIEKPLLKALQRLQKSLDGDLEFDNLSRTLYATDASVYREIPLAVAFPKNKTDIQKLIGFAYDHQTSIIPRTAGTSLAGQCVGTGIVADVSRYMNQILEVNEEENWVRVQPGVVRDALNVHLQPQGLFFGPNTSTANRAMIGGMVGNNSCGSYSIVYGTTRDHTLEISAILSDGSEAHFKAMDKGSFRRKAIGNSLENGLYRQINLALSHPETQREIREQFPKSTIHRRNTGYAVDELLKSNAFGYEGDDFNFCNLLAGSEGTLAFITEIKIHVDPLPPSHTGLLCIHYESINEALRAVLIAMKYTPRAVELMDKIVLDCTKDNIEQQKNRFFISGDPAAILMIEVGGVDKAAVIQEAATIETAMKEAGLGYHFPLIHSPDTKKVWTLRKAGLGLLANIPGDEKAVTVIEDTAVAIEDLPAYIEEVAQLMDRYKQQAVYYAHAGAGELHLRPILNLKDPADVVLFRKIGEETAALVKKYQGSLSGEHGDGRVRAEFIPLMVGEKNYQLFQQIKQTWDPQNIFNPGKIVNAPPMDTSLRYEPGKETPQFDTVFDFSDYGGILRAAEKCNGSGDCRKLPLSGGTMCPSYMATRKERDTTRARANTLREFLTQSEQSNRFDHEEIKEVMDLCLSCKGCTSECPSNVDMSTLKAEFTHQYYQTNGIPRRAKFFAQFSQYIKWATLVPSISNALMNTALSAPLKKMMGIAPQRSLPPVYKTTLKKWYSKNGAKNQPQNPKKTVYLFCDEFTNYNDTLIGIKAVELLQRLGYAVEMPDCVDSGRTYLSKGLLLEAKEMATKNVQLFSPLISKETPLIGIEPSAILSFRDEYLRLVPNDLQASAKTIAENCFLIDAFLWQEVELGNITASDFHTDHKEILVHGHCHQKALSSVDYTAWLLSVPTNYSVKVIPSGCCGMAGSFGYEAEHYDISMQIGELVLFPTVRKAATEVMVVAPGTSCRHQIADGTGKKAVHPVEVLWAARQ